MNYLDKTGLTRVWTNLKAKLANKVDKETGKGLSTNDFTTTLKNKLDGIETGAQVNTVTGVKGNSESSYRTGNINITKSNLGLGNVENKSSVTIRGEITSSNVTTALGYTPPTQDTTYSTATTSTDGLMSSSDKTKLDGIATGANKTTVDSSLSSTSTNPVQNKVINTALGNKVDKVSGKGLSTNDYTTDEKNKLAGIASGAQVNTVTGVKGNSEANYRTGNINITKSNIGLGNVDNKSSATIRGEITSSNVTTALGYTPAGQPLNTYSESSSDTYSCVYIDNLNTYSITEQRIGTWVDGKPIYRKVINTNVEINSTTFSQDINLSLSNIDRIWLNNRSTYIDSNGSRKPFPLLNAATFALGSGVIGANGCAGYFFTISNGVPTLKVRKGPDTSMASEELIVEYTKTTD